MDRFIQSKKKKLVYTSKLNRKGMERVGKVHLLKRFKKRTIYFRFILGILKQILAD